MMLVSQMQSSKKGRFPDKVPFGVGCLRVAETAAGIMGFDKMVVYSGKSHPIFKEHPENWRQLAETFIAVWDGSAAKLKYDGTRNSHYEKDLK